VNRCNILELLFEEKVAKDHRCCRTNVNMTQTSPRGRRRFGHTLVQFTQRSKATIAGARACFFVVPPLQQ
jgi:hypothetical protein